MIAEPVYEVVEYDGHSPFKAFITGIRTINPHVHDDLEGDAVALLDPHLVIGHGFDVAAGLVLAGERVAAVHPIVERAALRHRREHGLRQRLRGRLTPAHLQLHAGLLEVGRRILPVEAQRHIFPETAAQEAMGITGFTLATMYRWVRSDRGRSCTLHPYRKGHFPGSGQGAAVLAEAGLDAEGQYQAIRGYMDAMARSR